MIRSNYEPPVIKVYFLLAETAITVVSNATRARDMQGFDDDDEESEW